MDRGILGGCFGPHTRREKGLGEPPTRCEADRSSGPQHRRGGSPCVCFPRIPVDKDAAGDSRRGSRHLRPHTPHSVNPLSTIAHLSFAGLAPTLNPAAASSLIPTQPLACIVVASTARPARRRSQP